MSKYVAYFRVSTERQGQSGLGLEAQHTAVKAYADGIIHSFTEIESRPNRSLICCKAPTNSSPSTSSGISGLCGMN